MDEQAKKAALRMITYGLYVVTTKRDRDVNAFTCNWLSQASFQPPLVMMGVKKDSTSHDMIKESGVFAVNVLAQDQKDLAQKFFRPVHRVGNKFEDVAFELGQTGAPVLMATPAFFECRVVASLEHGDHAVFVGEVVNAGVHRPAEPLNMGETGWHYGG